MPPVPAPAKPELPATARPRMLSEVVHEKMRLGHYARRTEGAYLGWIRRFMGFCRAHPHLTPALSPPFEGAEREKHWWHPRHLGGQEVTEFRTHLAVVQELCSIRVHPSLGASQWIANWFGVGGRSPSPRPSPAGRGSHVVSGSNHRTLRIHEQALKRLPLPRRERAGVRVRTCGVSSAAISPFPRRSARY